MILILEELIINRETVRQTITEDLDMRNISAKLVPRILTDDQKQRRIPGEEIYNKHGPSTLFTWFSPLPFLAPSKIKKKNALKGQRFTDIPDIQRKVTTLLRGIPENDF
jgi:hypothetical protein